MYVITRCHRDVPSRGMYTYEFTVLEHIYQMWMVTLMVLIEKEACYIVLYRIVLLLHNGRHVYKYNLIGQGIFSVEGDGGEY